MNHDDDDDILIMSDQKANSNNCHTQSSQVRQSSLSSRGKGISPAPSALVSPCMFQEAECAMCMEYLKQGDDDENNAAPAAGGGDGAAARAQQRLVDRIQYLVALQCGHVFHTNCIEEFRKTPAAQHNKYHCPQCLTPDMIPENKCVTLVIDPPELWTALQPERLDELLYRTSTATELSTSKGGGISTLNPLRGLTAQRQITRVQQRYRRKLSVEEDELSTGFRNLSQRSEASGKLLEAVDEKCDELLTSLTFIEEMRCSFSGQKQEEEVGVEEQAQRKKKAQTVARTQRTAARTLLLNGSSEGVDDNEKSNHLELKKGVWATVWAFFFPAACSSTPAAGTLLPNGSSESVDDSEKSNHLELKKVTVPVWKTFATFTSQMKLKAETEEAALDAECAALELQLKEALLKEQQDLQAKISERKQQQCIRQSHTTGQVLNLVQLVSPMSPHVRTLLSEENERGIQKKQRRLEVPR